MTWDHPCPSHCYSTMRYTTTRHYTEMIKYQTYPCERNYVILCPCSTRIHTHVAHTWPHMHNSHTFASYACHTHTHTCRRLVTCHKWHQQNLFLQWWRELCERRYDCFSCVSRKQWSKLQVQCRALWWDLMLPVVLAISQWHGMLKSSSEGGFSSYHSGSLIVVLQLLGTNTFVYVSDSWLLI